MRWYVSNEGDVSGPLDAAEIRRGIDRGLYIRGMHVRDEQSSEWTPIERSPFAQKFVSAKAGPQIGESGKAFITKAATAAAWAAIFIVVGFAYKSCSKSEPKPDLSPEPKAYSWDKEEGTEEEENVEQTLGEILGRTKKLEDAISLLLPWMTDSNGEDMPAATAMLAAWANQHSSSHHLDEMPDSQFVEVMKDPQAYRGQKLCSSGSIVEIHADRSVLPPVYQGGLITNSGNVVRFIALGSTSGIVAGVTARFCGIFTGTQSYQNVSGGVTHAALTVGWFG